MRACSEKSREYRGLPNAFNRGQHVAKHKLHIITYLTFEVKTDCRLSVYGVVDHAPWQAPFSVCFDGDALEDVT